MGIFKAIFSDSFRAFNDACGAIGPTFVAVVNAPFVEPVVREPMDPSDPYHGVVTGEATYEAVPPLDGTVPPLPLKHVLRESSLLVRAFDDGVWPPQYSDALLPPPMPNYSGRVAAYNLAVLGAWHMLTDLAPAITDPATKVAIETIAGNLKEAIDLTVRRSESHTWYDSAKFLATTLNQSGERLSGLASALGDAEPSVPTAHVLRAYAKFIHSSAAPTKSGNMTFLYVRREKTVIWSHLVATTLAQLTASTALPAPQRALVAKIIKTLSAVSVGSLSGAWHQGHHRQFIAANDRGMKQAAQALAQLKKRSA